MDYRKRERCTGCDSAGDLKPVLKFGKIPLAGYFPRIEQIRDTKAYDCNLLFCDNCGMLQVDTIVAGEILFTDYRYMSSIGLSGHFKEVAKYLNQRFRLRENGYAVLEFGSNDGVLLKPLGDLGIRALGFEPSENISQVAKEKGCEVLVDFFNYDTARKHCLGGAFYLVVANNVFAHIDDLNAVTEGIKYCLSAGGSFVAEVHYLLNLVEQNQYDFVYHEHLYYHSLYSLNNFFRKHGITLYDFDLINVHSGSVRIFVRKGEERMPDAVARQIRKEQAAGITTSEGFLTFSGDVARHVESCKGAIAGLVAQGRTIVGFGASGRCNIFCNLLGLGTGQVKFIFDESAERVNRFIPGSNIPVICFDAAAAADHYDVVLIFAWNYANMIRKKIKAQDYLILFPEPELVKAEAEIQGIL